MQDKSTLHSVCSENSAELGVNSVHLAAFVECILQSVRCTSVSCVIAVSHKKMNSVTIGGKTQIQLFRGFFWFF